MADLIDVYFATNRDFINNDVANPKFGTRFNALGPQCFRVGRATVERRSKDDFVFRGAEVEEEDLELQQVGSVRLFSQLQDRLRSEKCDILLLIHGFASTFEDSLLRGAQLHHEYRITRKTDDGMVTKHHPAVFVFSWPSNGRVFPAYEYQSDRDDARASGAAMARALHRLITFLGTINQEHRAALRRIRAEELPAPGAMPRCEQRIHLVAHSMGNWALRHAVVALVDMIQMRPLPRVFEHVFLMAADEDDDCFDSDLKLALLPGLGKFVHVYHSRNDRALDVSDLTKGNPNRLGEDGPRNMETISNRVYAVDCSAVDETSLAHGRHQYYRLRDEVIEDVRAVLSGTAPESIPGREEARRARSFRIVPAADRTERRKG